MPSFIDTIASEHKGWVCGHAIEVRRFENSELR
jgi:hypothetical protein